MRRLQFGGGTFSRSGVVVVVGVFDGLKSDPPLVCFSSFLFFLGSFDFLF